MDSGYGHHYVGVMSNDVSVALLLCLESGTDAGVFG